MPCEVLALGAHPDDVELGCGGLVARLCRAGRVVGILDLTAGELGTRGDAARRRAEAETAAARLSVAWRHCLGLPDGGLDAADAQQRVPVVATLRATTPRALLLPHAGDVHPDHAAAAGLTRDACYLAGVARWHPELGAASRPRVLLAYPGPRQVLTPDVAVDVTASYAEKRAALAAHASQFEVNEGMPTHLASGYFLAAIEGRDRAVGNTIGCELAEGFAAVGTVSVDELVWLLGHAPRPQGAGS